MKRYEFVLNVTIDAENMETAKFMADTAENIILCSKEFMDDLVDIEIGSDIWEVEGEDE